LQPQGTKLIAQARHIAMYLAREKPTILLQIGRRSAGAITYILHGCAKITGHWRAA